jgi:hypothetical protein
MGNIRKTEKCKPKLKNGQSDDWGQKEKKIKNTNQNSKMGKMTTGVQKSQKSKIQTKTKKWAK